MTKRKLLNIFCSLLVGVVFTVVMLLVMALSGAVSLQQTKLVFSTSSASAVYDGKPLTNHKWELADGELKPGHRVKVTFTGKQTSVGESENTIKVKILDAANADVTGDYDIAYELGKLTVSPRALTVTSMGASKVYDGTPLMNPEYKLTEIIPGHTAAVLVVGSQTEVGFSNNTIAMVKIIDRAGNDVTNNYVITKTEQPLVVNGAGGGGIDFSQNSAASKEELEKIILYKFFSDTSGKVYLKRKSFGDYTGRGFAEAKRYTSLLSNRYSASYLMSFALSAKDAKKANVQIEQVQSTDYALPYYMATTIYGGYEIQTNDVENIGTAKKYSVDYYLDNVTPAASHSTYLYRTYEKNYRRFVYENYTKIDEETQNYLNAIIGESGLSATDKDIVQKVASLIKNCAEYDIEYDRSLDKEKNIVISFLRDYKTGVCKHYAMSATMLYRALGIPARYTVGTLVIAKEGEWVEVNALSSHAWVEVYIDGVGWKMVEVTGGSAAEMESKYEISPVKVDMLYNGDTLYAENAIDGFEKFAKMGYRYENLSVSGSRVEVGISQSTIDSITIYDPEGNDVTHEFRLKKGEIHVYSREITVLSNNASFVYGESHSPAVSVIGGEMLHGHNIVASFSAKQTAGRHSNTFTVAVTDADGNDVTHYYKINRFFGVLEIKQRAITVTAGSASKAYDGEALTCDEYSIEGTLVEGDYVHSYTIFGEQTNIGRCDNEISDFVIYNSEGENVTSNYNITLEPGILRVTR